MGRKSFFSAAYNAGFTMYRSYSDLNSFEYGTRVSASRRLTAFTTISAHQSYASYPTTAMETLVGLPFVRLGSRVGIVGTAVESALTKVTTVSGSYDFEWVRFEEDPSLGRPLGRWTLAQGPARPATPAQSPGNRDCGIRRLRGLTSGGPFSIHNGWLGGDYRLTDRVSVFGNIGIARLDTPRSAQRDDARLANGAHASAFATRRSKSSTDAPLSRRTAGAAPRRIRN